MSMTMEIMLLWAVFALLPVSCMIYVIHRFDAQDSNINSLFETIQQQLSACLDREVKMIARIEELERLIRAHNHGT